MKLKRNTATQLIFESKPVFASIALVIMIVMSIGFGLVFVGLGLEQGSMLLVAAGAGAPILTIILCTAVMRSVVKRARIIFDRDAGTITFRTRDMRGDTETVHDLAHLERATLKSRRTSDSKTYTQAVLVLSSGPQAGEHPLINRETQSNSHKNAVDAINRWLETTA